MAPLLIAGVPIFLLIFSGYSTLTIFFFVRPAERAFVLTSCEEVISVEKCIAVSRGVGPPSRLSLDIETFSSVDLSRSGVYRYAESPDFCVLLIGYSFDGGPVCVADLASGEVLPEELLFALLSPSVEKWAFNAAFERVCLSRLLRDKGYLKEGSFLSPSSWRCSMIWSAYLGLPMSLAGVGAVLGLEKQKLSAGKDLIRYFCRPVPPSLLNGGGRRNLPSTDPERWKQFVSYNLRDVETELAIHDRLAGFPVPASVWTEYEMDQRINDRGILVDLDFVSSALSVDAQSRAALVSRLSELTKIANPNSVPEIRAWLSDHGQETENLSKAEVRFPERIRVIREVTGEKEYTNPSIARVR